MGPEYSDAKRKLLEKYLQGEFGLRPEAQRIGARPPGERIPLSHAQEQVWVHAQLAPELPLYNEPVTIHYSGRLDVSALQRSFNEILRRHEAWRTSFVVLDGQPFQEVKDHLFVSLSVIDLRSIPDEQREATAVAIATADARIPIDMGQTPLFRVRLIRLRDEEHRLYLTLSHIIFDGVAIYRVFLPELAALYKAYSAGEPSPLADLAIQYPDYAVWERRTFTQETLAKDIQYWREKLTDTFPETYLPTDRPEERSRSFRGSMYPFKLNTALKTAFRNFCRSEGVSLFHLLLAGFAALLYRQSGQERIPIGSVTAGRNRPETSALLGYFLNTVVMPADLSGDPSFRSLVRRGRNWTIDALDHDRVPFEHLVRELKVDRVPGRNPLFQALFSLEPPMPEVDPAWRLTQMDVDTGASKYDLSLELDERSEEVLARFHYNTDLFDAATIVRMAAQWQRLLQGAVADPDQRISQLPLLTSDEQRQIVVDWNNTEVDVPGEQIIHKYFEEQAERSPGVQAVAFDGQSLTYDELNCQANQVARYLRDLGVGPEVVVGLYFERSPEMVVGILGVLKAGGACLPLDPTHPAGRLAFMLAETQAPVLLTHSRFESQLQSQVAGGKAQIICVDAFSSSSEKVHSSPPCEVKADNTAYVIYTSGSTGQPKGVRVLHRGMVNSTFARIRFYPEAVKSFLLLSSFTFDSSLAGIFWTLSVGGTLVLPPDQSRWELDSLSRLVEKHQVSHLLCVPSLYKTLMESSPSGRLASLKVAIVAGESCPVTLVKDHFRRLPHAALYNEYGPTEATVWCSVYRCEPRDESNRVPIGRPIANTQLYVLDSHLQVVPVGVPGELHVAGAGVTGGYWNRPDLTAERFIANPFSPTPGESLYKTGDLARFLPDGNIEYLGRIDHQVKVRGFRIELGEIEAALVSHPAVGEAVVIAREDTPGDQRLVTYYTAVETSAPDAAALDAEHLRAHLLARLPEYMVPAAYVRLTSMPLTPTGKLDRKALPAPEADAYAVHGYEAPRGEIESALAAIWGEVLKLDRVGRHDNFFELGGHSLLAVILIERMRRQGLQVDVRALFAASTLAELAATVEAKASVIAIPPNQIPAECTLLTPEMLPLATLTQDEIDRVVGSVPGGVANVQDIYSLAPLQEGILFHHLMGGEGDPYLLATLLSFDTRERLDGYLKAMQSVINRNDILRTAVMWEGLSQPVQVVQHRAPLPIQEIELDPADGDVGEQLYARFDPRRCRLDLRQAPLLRAYIAFDQGQDRWLMMQLLHHLLADHTTMEVMQEEIQAHLLGQAELLPAPLPFRNLVAQARLGVSKEEHEAFFRKMLADVEEPTTPFGLFDVQSDGTGIEEARVALEAALAERVRERARRLGISAASLCHLAWARVLARVSGREDVVFGTVLFGRMQGGAGSDRVMGLFTNTLPVRIRIGEEGVESCVRQTHALLAEIMRHEHASLALAQRCSAVPAPAPLFSALLNYRHSPGAGRTARAWEDIRTIRVEERTNYPFTLSVDDVDGEGFWLTAQTVASVDPRRVCQYIETTLESLVAALETTPSLAVRKLEVLPASEQHQLLYEWNDTRTEFPSQPCIHQLFEEQVRTCPDATAVVYEEASLTYAELNRHANRLAHYLRGLGVKPDARVAICVERGLEMVVALLAVLKAGGAYVPLDPAYPGERLRFMLEDCAPVALLTQKHLQPLFAEPPDAVRLVDVSADTTAWSHQLDSNPDCASVGLTPQHLAYVIYTSGSTGTPKGVMVEHRNVTRLFVATDAWFHFSRSDIWTLFHSYAFDFSVWEIWGALLYGGRLIVVSKSVVHSPGDFYKLLCQTGVTILNQTPSAFRQLVTAQEASRELHQLRHVIFGGEALEVATLKPWYEQNNGQCTGLVNMYGITETTVHVTYRPLPRTQAEGGEGNLIGRRIPDLRIYILDECGEPAPVGVAGEMYIGGAGVARGYLNRPELTAERFLADPFAADAGARMYKTGDLGRWQSDETIEFVGRNDFQVKIRGFRIELGEIEARLAEHAGVQEAVVIAREDTPGDKRLVAYYTAADTNGQRNGAVEFRSHLSGKLPGYMLPAAYVRLTSMPLTPNGKLDRKALPLPEGDVYAVRGYEEPQGEIETRLVKIWADLLNVGRVGRQDNFFELGGHSLLAMQLTARIGRTFEVELTVRSVFEAPTIAGLAMEVEKARAMSLTAHALGLKHHPFTVVAGADQEALRIQLEKLSVEEARKLLKLLRDGKQSVEFRA
ncbi:MAG TPA: amino acid adenylation domain-containing protein [Candidatus Sulfotelmatobacter sp.]